MDRPRTLLSPNQAYFEEQMLHRGNISDLIEILFCMATLWLSRVWVSM